MRLIKEETDKVRVAPLQFAEACGLETVYAPEDKEIALSTMSVSRPGLLLSGYTEYFASSRVQVLGKSEITYLGSLPPDIKAERLTSLFSQSIPCLIVSRGQKVSKEILDAAKEFATPVFRSEGITATVINEVTTYLNELLAPSVSMHGIMLDVYGIGVMIMGESGIGKSETALELIHRGHRLVSDDLIEFKRVRDEIFGEAPAIIKHMMEIRGLGIIDVKAIYGVGAVKKRKRLELVIGLENWAPDKEYSRVGNSHLSETILDIPVPKYIIPIMPGRNLAILIEVAVRDFRLKQEGYDTLSEIEKRMEEEQT